MHRQKYFPKLANSLQTDKFNLDDKEVAAFSMKTNIALYTVILFIMALVGLWLQANKFMMQPFIVR